MKTTLSLLLLVLLSALDAAQAQTFTKLGLVTPSLVTAPAGSLKPGALYKYANAASGVDAYILYVKNSNTGSDNVGLFAFDNLASVNNPGGYDSSFQPVTSCSNVNSTGLWTAGGSCSQSNVRTSYSASENYLAHFRLYFKKAGTNTDTALNIKAAFIDIDGFGSGTEAEQNAFMPGVSYAISSNTNLTFSTRSDGLINAEGDPANIGGIQFTQTASVTQVTYLNRTYIDFGVGMNTHSASGTGGCYNAVAGGRLASVSFGTQPTGLTVVVPTSITLSGTIWDDADGSAAGTFTNIRTNSEPGTAGDGLYVYALDSATETVLGKATVAANGTWSIANLAKNNPIKLVLSNANVSVGVTNGNPDAALNAGWVGMSPLTRSSVRYAANTSSLDFGIEEIPVGNDYTAPSQLNPGGTIKVPVLSAAFTGSDPEDGTYATGLSGKTVTLSVGINGNLYYNNVLVGATQIITGFDPTKLFLDPTGPTPTTISNVTATFTYTVKDAAGQASVAKTITMPFQATCASTISSNFNGTAISAGRYVWFNAHVNLSNYPSTPFHVRLSSSTIAFANGATNYSLPVPNADIFFSATAASASYSYSPATGYQIIVPLASASNGEIFLSGLPLLVPAGGFSGGINPVSWTGSFSTDVTGLGIQWQWSAAVYTSFSNDPEALGIQLLHTSDHAGTPNNFKSFVTGGARGGGGSNYTGSWSGTGNAASCVINTFVFPSINGNVYDDANALIGTPSNTVDGVGVPAGLSYVLLLESTTNKVIAQTIVLPGGGYKFINQDVGNYIVVLSNTLPGTGATVTTASLPSTNYVFTGENLGATAGNDGTVDGKLAVSLVDADVFNANLGIEQRPFANTTTAPIQKNPGGAISATVPAATFVGSDIDGIVSNIRITAFPTNVTSLTINTTTYYVNAAAIPGVCPTATCAAFPAAGITTASGTTGQPTATVKVDPLDGTITVNIPFATIDNANKESLVAGNAKVPFYVPLPPIALDIDNDPINNSVAHTHIGAFVASDPQGDPILSYKVLSLPLATEGILYTCSNNTVPCTGTFSAVTLNQVLTPAQSATLYIDPVSSFIGTTTFLYNATSQNGTSNTAVETIPIINNPPTANSFTTAAVMKNSAHNKVPPLSGADGDGVVVSYTVTPPSPAHGSITYCVNPPNTGCFTPIGVPTVLTPAQISAIYFTPTTDFTGTASFTYTVTDNNSLVSKVATVLIPVTPLALAPDSLPPITQNITIAPLNSDAGSTLISRLIGTDPDGVIVTYKILTIPAANTGTLYYCTTGNYPCIGTLTAVTANTVITPAQSQTLQFDPAADNSTGATFTYNATDNQSLLSNTSTYVIPIFNLPPTAVTIQTKVPFNSVNYPIPALQGNDEDGVVVSYKITAIPNVTTEGRLYTCSNNTLPCTGTYTQVTLNQVLTPAQVATLTFTPTTGFTGTATGVYTVTDNNGNVSQPADIILKIDDFGIVGQPPVAAGSSVDMSANAPRTPLPSTFIRATDPDGTISNFIITSLPPASQGVYTYCTAPPATGCNTPLAAGLVLTPLQAANLSFTPNQTYSGPSFLGFFATDNSGNLSNLAHSVVNISSLPPIATGYTTASVKNGGPTISTPLLASDPLDNGTVVSYKINSIPTAGNGAITYCATPPATGCNTPITVGTVLTPAQAATVSYTPGVFMTVHEVTFTFTATDNSNNLSNVATIVVPRVEPPSPCIKIRAYLEGSLMNNGNAVASDTRPLMRDNLRANPVTGSNFIPILDPYEFATAGVNVVNRYIKYQPQSADYPQFQRVTSSTVFTVTGQEAIVDWVFVELRNKSNNAQVLSTRAGLLQRDGDIVEVDGTSCLSFPGVALDSYFVAVRHRSHLGTMTKYAQSSANLHNLVNLTAPTTPLYDKGVVGFNDFTGLSQKANVKGSYRAMWQGDFDADGKVKYDNPNDDLAVMLFDVLLHPNNVNGSTNFDFAYGYYQGDFDMNAKVKFDNPNDDNAMLLFQVLLYPNNSNGATNFDFVLQQLP